MIGANVSWNATLVITIDPDGPAVPPTYLTTGTGLEIKDFAGTNTPALGVVTFQTNISAGWTHVQFETERLAANVYAGQRSALISFPRDAQSGLGLSPTSHGVYEGSLVSVQSPLGYRRSVINDFPGGIGIEDDTAGELRVGIIGVEAAAGLIAHYAQIPVVPGSFPSGIVPSDYAVHSDQT